MANKPFFMPDDKRYVAVGTTDYLHYMGCSKSQRQKSAKSLEAAVKDKIPAAHVLEISSFSDKELGIRLSAFNLQITLQTGKRVPVELAFQAGKVFENAGPFKDLLDVTSVEAKKDPRLKSSGSIRRFEFEGQSFPTEPVTLFYTWLYLHGLNENPELAQQLPGYDVFTDIAFNPARAMNCQAFVCALYVSLKKKGEFEKALNDKDFLSRILLLCSSYFILSRFEKERKSSVPGPVSVSEKKDEKKKKADGFSAHLNKGDMIEHPKYGKGTVNKIIRGDGYAHLFVRFEETGQEKQLMESWVLKYCTCPVQNPPSAS